ncbi:pyrroline-5-carboxylate reductase [Reinekea marinisedimentorum]|uniref:Pyrroline-5-carboxylate reductase n=1 Tax=Reinekea marinisedimentorum TaxID=230495 RepID=A0A4R3HY56_9GAMM|nr:pyrroline-5-carboxylate reductase [Reinekea marinisedimentorum]TCS38132.1 pyrroline-5-carboxylate reductase [Reinekea marinisedimentorum]
MSIQKLGFIGGGNMANAIIGGLIESGFAASDIMVCDLNEAQLTRFANAGSKTTTQAVDVMQWADAVVLAVKPQVLKAVVTPLAEYAQQHRPLVISIVAAIPSTSIDQWLGGNNPIIRTMPNTPALVKAGATGLFANERTSEAQQQFAEQLFSAIGQAVWVSDENLLHSVTAAAGSAPAYFFRFAEAMTKAAMTQNLSEQQARELIGQTMLGAAKMIMETDESIEQMCKNVCSPNGTTERAVASFESNHIDSIVGQAMTACYERSIELSEQLAD